MDTIKCLKRRHCDEYLENLDQTELDEKNEMFPMPSRRTVSASRGMVYANAYNNQMPIEVLDRWVDHEKEIKETNEILSRLYNYMKISEMSKYGINVFQKILDSYLLLLNERDIFTLVTSYWCNGTHFTCIVRHRDKLIRNKNVLKLPITDELLDAAITGGSSAEKIKEMLKQRRIDNSNMSLAACIQQDQEFFIRNCRYRFWNHEVLVKAFLENGWLDPELGQIALDQFASCIYDRRMKNSHTSNRFEMEIDENSNNTKNNEHTQNKAQCKFVLKAKTKPLPISQKTLHRWVNVVEILTSRGAKCSLNRFALPMLQRSVMLGTYTWNFINLSTEIKNELLMDTCNLTMPLELWNVLVSFF